MSLSFQARSAVRTLFLWLGLAALTVQAVAPLCAAGFAGGSQTALTSIVLCTAHGFQRIQIDADGQPVPTQGDQKGSDCFLCVGMHGGGAFPAPVLVSVDAPSISRAAAVFVPRILPPQRKFASAYVTRGPPALIV